MLGATWDSECFSWCGFGACEETSRHLRVGPSCDAHARVFCAADAHRGTSDHPVTSQGDAEKAAWFADDRAKRRNKTAVVLVLDVDVGRCKVIDATACSGKHKEGCECKQWLKEEYESQYVAAGKGVNREETVLRHPRQISVVGEI